LKLEGEDRGRLGLGDLHGRGRCSYWIYGTHMSHPPEHTDEILSSASGRVHYWPVRWR
jgi:hypothetical protein